MSKYLRGSWKCLLLDFLLLLQTDGTIKVRYGETVIVQFKATKHQGNRTLSSKLPDRLGTSWHWILSRFRTDSCFRGVKNVYILTLKPTVCLSSCLSALCLSVCLSVCLFCLSARLSVCPSVCPLSVCLSVCLLFICLATCLHHSFSYVIYYLLKDLIATS